MQTLRPLYGVQNRSIRQMRKIFKERTSDRAHSCDPGHGKTCNRCRASNRHGYRTCTVYRFPRGSNRSSPTLTRARAWCCPDTETHRSHPKGLPLQCVRSFEQTSHEVPLPPRSSWDLVSRRFGSLRFMRSTVNLVGAPCPTIYGGQGEHGMHIPMKARASSPLPLRASPRR
jgi:hypothetical protein